MKRVFTFALFFFFVLFPLMADKTTKSDATTEKKSKLNDIRKLMEITGSGNLGIQVMNNMIESYKKMLPDVPSSFWESFIKEVDADSLVELIVPIYDKYLTHDEIKDIIKFYESPSGRKLVKVLPMITNESMEAGSKWGKEIGNRLMQRLQQSSEQNNLK